MSRIALFAANRAFALTNSRIPLFRRLLEAGWTVVAATGWDEHAQRLVDEGVTFERLDFRRGNFAPLGDLRAAVRLARIVRKHRPALIHLFHLKPILLGNLVSRLVTRAKVVNTVTGLGFGLLQRDLHGWGARRGHRLLLGRSDATIFQNPDDLELVVGRGWVKRDQAWLVVSSGVDVGRFHPAPVETDAPVVLMVARLLWDKGVREFVTAAPLVRDRIPGVRFVLAGEVDVQHPNAVPESWLQREPERAGVEYVGYERDMVAALHGAAVFVLPSYYREGVPRVLLEAAASGVPVVACDAPGTREAVRHGSTGLLVPPGSAEALAEALVTILESETTRRSMGSAARTMAEREFDIRQITRKQLEVYAALGLPVGED